VETCTAHSRWPPRAICWRASALVARAELAALKSHLNCTRAEVRLNAGRREAALTDADRSRRRAGARPPLVSGAGA